MQACGIMLQGPRRLIPAGVTAYRIAGDVAHETDRRPADAVNKGCKSWRWDCRRSGEITLPHAQAVGTSSRRTGCRGVAACLIVDEEERLVFLIGPAERAAELVQIELLFGRCEIAARIESRVAEEFEERSVKLVGAGFRGHQDRRTRAGSVFCRVVVGQNFEFLDGVDRRQ